MTWQPLPHTPDESDQASFALDVLTGLSERPKRLSSRWFYDDRGSELFEQIMAEEEYYPTNLEREIFEAQGDAIAARFAGQDIDVVDLGAGDGTKTFLLLDALRRAGVTTRYVPVDISEGAMASLHAKVEAKLPDQAVHGLVGDYVGALRHLSTVDDRHRLVLFLGSNIGNFDKPRARAFLRRLWTGLRPGDHALIGFDLKKDIEVLLAAYNDRNGTTSAFNLNLLARINRELGGHFDLSEWRHYGTYNVFTGAMESYIVSLKEQHVAIDALRTSFHFMPWEPIHTEYSYKYLDHDITDLAAFTGFEIVSRFCDDKKWFCDALWRVR